MRLTATQRKRAKAELLMILLNGPRTTGELQGTWNFHGHRTLSFHQIRTLLRKTGKVVEGFYGAGMYTSTLWSLEPERAGEIARGCRAQPRLAREAWGTPPQYRDMKTRFKWGITFTGDDLRNKKGGNRNGETEGKDVEEGQIGSR